MLISAVFFLALCFGCPPIFPLQHQIIFITSSSSNPQISSSFLGFTVSATHWRDTILYCYYFLSIQPSLSNYSMNISDNLHPTHGNIVILLLGRFMYEKLGHQVLIFTIKLTPEPKIKKPKGKRERGIQVGK